MKLFRHGAPGHERPGMLAPDGVARDLSEVIGDITGRSLDALALASLSAVNPDSLPTVPNGVRRGPPVGAVGKIVAIGLNYADHAREASLPVPDEPVIFLKAITSLCGPDDDTIVPRGSRRLDWEVELAIVIGSRASGVTESRALDHVAGYCVANDVSERYFQLELGSQWDKGKGCDTFCPLGPYLVTRDEVPDPQALDLWLDVNGQRMQTGSTSTMVFSCAQIVSYVSRFMTLCPGDVVITGTPPGVGIGRSPQKFLTDGDVVTLGISGLGTQRQIIRDPRG
jgi:2,4-didehydro-3-deoxy-L-rhamnonate hydrolase